MSMLSASSATSSERTHTVGATCCDCEGAIPLAEVLNFRPGITIPS
jgi:hypothetical protein